MVEQKLSYNLSESTFLFYDLNGMDIRFFLRVFVSTTATIYLPIIYLEIVLHIVVVEFAIPYIFSKST